MLTKKSMISVISFLFLSLFLTAQQAPLSIWYTAPAAYWEARVPLGNGRLGAMPDGGVFHENICLNDITLWSGSPQNADKPEAYKHLPEIQKLLSEGKNIEAQEIMSKYFVCEGRGSGEGNGAKVPYGSFEMLGNLTLTYQYEKDSAQSIVSGYHRQLSLDSALATTSFFIGNTFYSREYFTSFGDDVIVMRLTSGESKKINFSMSLNRPEKFETTVADGLLQMTGQLENGVNGKGMKYVVKVAIKPEGGSITTSGNSLQLRDANSAVIFVSAATDYKDADFISTASNHLNKALVKSYGLQKQNHLSKFQPFFKSASLQLGNNERDSLPTDKRLEAFGAAPADKGLAALYFQFGRYLLICSTRPGLLPPNLQGLWANTIQTPWNGDYHLNINIQMNHWPLEVTNLSALNEPFFSFVRSLVAPGERTTKAYYNAKGWVAHTIANIWGYTSPGEHYSWGSFNTGSAWLCQMLWSHYEFTKDQDYLQQLYPILKGSSEFYLGALVKEKEHGWLVTSPSNSPENAFIMPDGRTANVCEGPSIDNQILRFLFSATIDACKQLKKDEALKQQLEAAVKLLPPTQIASDGRLMEWLKEYKEAEPHHRHTSHLWALHPGTEITSTTPALTNAARASLEARGDDGTGWSLAWKINFWARLQDGNRAYHLLRNLLRPVYGTGFNMTTGGGTYINLFCGHTPYQIDGNFGGTAGIAEMLIQSHAGYIELLPALPDEWSSGSFSGLCARGGGEVSAQWANGKVSRAGIKAVAANMFKIKMPANTSKAEIKIKGKPVVKPGGGIIAVELKKGEVAEISFR